MTRRYIGSCTHSPRRSWLTRLDDTDFGAKVDFCRRRKTGEPSEADWDQPITALVRVWDRTRVVVMTTDRVVRITSLVDWIHFHTTTKHAGSIAPKARFSLCDNWVYVCRYGGGGVGNRGSGVVIGVQVGIWDVLHFVVPYLWTKLGVFRRQWTSQCLGAVVC